MTHDENDEIAGAIEPFEDAALYDWEYRRRRDDVAFYRTLAGERSGPVLDLGCGTGRLLVPLLRDGHVVIGIDRSWAMLARAAQRLGRTSAATRARALLLRADLRQFALRRRATFAVAAFHSVQHLITDGDLRRFLRAARAALVPGGWLAFDLFAPDQRFLQRDSKRRWDRTVFRHPALGTRFVYTMSPRFDPARRTLLMRMYYQPVDGRGRANGRERTVRLCHRLLSPPEVEALLKRAGFSLISRWSGFDGRPADDESEQQIFLARRV
ncbi:MAG TPA: class I SAM-dependent methyltransferase [Polyangia bacterium]|jgi:SAM-dependent methyltransferase|nr:class I SAM-dependent methyltransferase [Polyangia bacterium]